MKQPGKTNAVRLLESAGIGHRVVAYDLAGTAFSAEAVADAIGLPHERVFKTLAARTGDVECLAVVPAGTELDLRSLARSVGAKKMELVPVAQLERLTGYRRGSVTALGTRRPLPVYLDESAMEQDEIAVSAGAEGLQVVLAPGDYAKVTEATIALLTRGGSPDPETQNPDESGSANRD